MKILFSPIKLMKKIRKKTVIILNHCFVFSSKWQLISRLAFSLLPQLGVGSQPTERANYPLTLFRHIPNFSPQTRYCCITIQKRQTLLQTIDTQDLRIKTLDWHFLSIFITILIGSSFVFSFFCSFLSFSRFNSLLGLYQSTFDKNLK